jgi:hypothetical protein
VAGTTGDDVMFISDFYVAVIDGATSKNEQMAELDGGRLAAQAIADAMQHLRHDATYREFFDIATNQLARLKNRLEPAAGWIDGAPSASTIVLSVARMELWNVGDGWWSIDGKVRRFSNTIEEHAEAVRSIFLLAEQARGVPVMEQLKNDQGREYILPILRNAHLFRNVENSPWGFGTIDGSHIPTSFINVSKVPPGSEVTLATDGYPSLLPTLKSSEEFLMRQIQSDPLFISDFKATKGAYPGTRSFDDRTYIRVAL